MQRVGVLRHARGDEIHERRVLGEDRVHRLDDGLDPLFALRGEPLLERPLRRIASSRHSAREMRLMRFPFCERRVSSSVTSLRSSNSSSGS